MPVLAGVAAVLVAYGLHAFAKLDFFGYISLQTRFAFIDPMQSVPLFVCDHLAVFALCALVGAGLAVALGQRRARRPSSGWRSQ